MERMDGLFLPLMLALLVGFMFLSFRNNKKRQQAQQQLQAQAVPGARVQLTSGLFGTIVGDEGETVEVEIAPGVVTTWNRLAIRDVITEGADAPAVETEDEDAFRVPDYTEEDAARDAAAEKAAAEKAAPENAAGEKVADDAPEIAPADTDTKDK